MSNEKPKKPFSFIVGGKGVFSVERAAKRDYVLVSSIPCILKGKNLDRAIDFLQQAKAYLEAQQDRAFRGLDDSTTGLNTLGQQDD